MLKSEIKRGRIIIIYGESKTGEMFKRDEEYLIVTGVKLYFVLFYSSTLIDLSDLFYCF